MGVIFAFLVIWCVGWLIFAAIAPLLGQMLWHLGKFLLLCLKITLRLTGAALWWLATDGRRYAVAGVCAAFLFARIFWDEWHRPAEEPGEGAGADPFEAALALLGLHPAFTREELVKAYKQAIRRAHPDAGGSVKQAAAINAARDLIMIRKGWAAAARAA